MYIGLYIQLTYLLWNNLTIYKTGAYSTSIFVIFLTNHFCLFPPFVGRLVLIKSKACLISADGCYNFNINSKFHPSSIIVCLRRGICNSFSARKDKKKRLNFVGVSCLVADYMKKCQRRETRPWRQSCV